jgi:hypothetical protein
MSITNSNELDIVEDALQTWPVAETPPGFSHRVLQRIETTRYSRFKFQFTWLDYALGLFAVSGTLLVVLIWSALPDLFIMRLTYRIFLVLNMPQYQSLLIYFFLGVGGFLIFILLTAILFTYPSTFNRKLTVSI